MAVPNNILEVVQTYQKAELAFLLNSFCGISLSNKKFQRFNEMTANLGDTITFDRGPRYITYNGLVITQQQSDQLVQTMSASQSANVSAAYTDQQFIFQVREYMDRFGEAAMKKNLALKLKMIFYATLSQAFILMTRKIRTMEHKLLHK